MGVEAEILGLNFLGSASTLAGRFNEVGLPGASPRSAWPHNLRRTTAHIGGLIPGFLIVGRGMRQPHSRLVSFVIWPLVALLPIRRKFAEEIARYDLQEPSSSRRGGRSR